MSDNGASQEGGPLGMVNAMGPYNGKPEPIAEKIARIDDIGGPDTHANFPWGWAMAANTPLKRYKQNTHGGGIRDPLVVSWPNGIAARGELRHGFRHACDVVPTLLEVLRRRSRRETIAGVAQQPIEGVSFAASFGDADPPRGRAAVLRDVRPPRACGRTAGRRSPTIRPGRRSRTTSGSSTTWTTDFSESRRPRRPRTRTSSPS